MKRTNKTLSSQDNVYGLEKYSANYNVRHHDMPDGLEGLKAHHYDVLEEIRIVSPGSYPDAIKNMRVALNQAEKGPNI